MSKGNKDLKITLDICGRKIDGKISSITFQRGYIELMIGFPSVTSEEIKIMGGRARTEIRPDTSYLVIGLPSKLNKDLYNKIAEGLSK